MSQCSGPRETGHVQRSMLYALEPYILNLSLGLTCYLVVYAISALLSYNEILERGVEGFKFHIKKNVIAH